MTWQPIETAPRDGTRVLLFIPSGPWGVIIGWWNDHRFAKKPSPYWEAENRCIGVREMREAPPTHWMPLPEAP